MTKDAVYLLTKKAALPLRPMPPNFRNHGNYVTSIAKLGRFLGEKAEEAGVYLLTETAADKLLVDDNGNSFITFEDYAVAVLDELERPGHIGKRFGVAY